MGSDRSTHHSPVRSRERSAFTLVELLVVIAIIGTLVGLLLPAVQSAREAARRMQCQNNMKQIGLALHTYQSVYRKFPVGSNVSNFISPHVGLLPYLEQFSNFEKWDFGLSYSSEHNAAVGAQRISTFLCPSMTIPREVPLAAANETGGPNSYLFCEGTGWYMEEADGLFGLHWPPYGYNNPSRSFRDVTDGTSNTFVAGETIYDYDDYLWSSYSPDEFAGKVKYGTARWVVGYPRITIGTALRPFNLHTAAAMGGFASMHAGGANFVYADGSVHYLSDRIDGVVYRGAATRSGSELPSEELHR